MTIGSSAGIGSGIATTSEPRPRAGCAYAKGKREDFDADKGIFLKDVLAYVQASQGKKWLALSDLQGPAAGPTLIDALVKELASTGTLSVLRNGFKCFGKTFQMAAFQPASGMNPDAQAAYNQNILTITRQVAFNPDTSQTVDAVVSVNGLSIATLELKNPMSGQTVENAKRQYENDRDPKLPLFRFKERALVHFAVDPDLIFMATKLEGSRGRSGHSPSHA